MLHPSGCAPGRLTPERQLGPRSCRERGKVVGSITAGGGQGTGRDTTHGKTEKVLSLLLILVQIHVRLANWLNLLANTSKYLAWLQATGLLQTTCIVNN